VQPPTIRDLSNYKRSVGCFAEEGRKELGSWLMEDALAIWCSTSQHQGHNVCGSHFRMVWRYPKDRKPYPKHWCKQRDRSQAIVKLLRASLFWQELKLYSLMILEYWIVRVTFCNLPWIKGCLFLFCIRTTWGHDYFPLSYICDIPFVSH